MKTISVATLFALLTAFAINAFHMHEVAFYDVDTVTHVELDVECSLCDQLIPVPNVGDASPTVISTLIQLSPIPWSVTVEQENVERAISTLSIAPKTSPPTSLFI